MNVSSLLICETFPRYIFFLYKIIASLSLLDTCSSLKLALLFMNYASLITRCCCCRLSIFIFSLLFKSADHIFHFEKVIRPDHISFPHFLSLSFIYTSTLSIIYHILHSLSIHIILIII